MLRENSYRRHNDAQDAVLLAWVLILGIFGILYFLAYGRLHVRAGQLVEFTIYPLLVAIFLWDGAATHTAGGITTTLSQVVQSLRGGGSDNKAGAISYSLFDSQAPSVSQIGRASCRERV